MRAIRYNQIKLLRIVDDPRRVIIGVFIGTLVAFTPFFGFHFLLAPALAWAVGGNLLASLIATTVCNPITFPFIAYAAVSVGRWILGSDTSVHDLDNVEETNKTVWNHFYSFFDGNETPWQDFVVLFEQLIIPYLIGGMLLGFVAASIAAWLTARAVASFGQWRRRMKEK